jgi:hypothetical protein
MSIREIKPGVFEAICDHCGKPLEVTTKYGMFCKDLCGSKEAKIAMKLIDRLARNLLKMAGR